jgi:holo-[acyl-carrier protein] synthase
MIITGVDIIELERISNAVERFGNRFLRRVYTDREIEYCRSRIPQLAGRFAAKEAVMKAFGTGLYGLGWKDVEVVRLRGRRPEIEIHGRGLAIYERQGITQINLSISHSRDYAVALVVGEKH